MVVLRVLWILFENICFALGLFCLIFILTTYVDNHTITINKNGEQMYCFSRDFKNCVETLNERVTSEKH